MNVGAIINATILHAANINNVALPFPSLLTELFKKARINMADNSVCKVIWALNHNGIICIWYNQPEEGEDEAGPSRALARPRCWNICSMVLKQEALYSACSRCH